MLDKQEIRRLRAQAHPLKPEMQVGKEGLNPALIAQIYDGFNTKELLKVKMLDTCPDDRQTLALKLSELPKITLVQNIGHTYTLYKKMEEKNTGRAKAKKKDAKPAKKRSVKKAAPKPARSQPAAKSVTKPARKRITKRSFGNH